ncbi:MAG: hypothetical protein LBS96_07320, partial [Oscillospiraceae bacterium]|nr:hypothetical protein [Oscillospiraceae bacterium]
YRYNPLHSHQVAFNEYNASYEIEFIRQISDTRIYCVQKVLNGYFFTFWYGGWDNGNVRDDGWLYNAAYIQKSLEWKAFSSIKEGANSADVGKIDPAVSEWIDIASQYDSPSIQATLILKDGLLVLDFSKQKNAYTVQQISFYADFKLMSVSGEVIYDYSILPQDYPG